MKIFFLLYNFSPFLLKRVKDKSNEIVKNVRASESTEADFGRHCDENRHGKCLCKSQSGRRKSHLIMLPAHGFWTWPLGLSGRKKNYTLWFNRASKKVCVCSPVSPGHLGKSKGHNPWFETEGGRQSPATLFQARVARLAATCRVSRRVVQEISSELRPDPHLQNLNYVLGKQEGKPRFSQKS